MGMMMSRLGIFRIAILTVMLASFGLRSAVPEGYMVSADEAGDSLVIELCSGTKTKFIRLNLATGTSETVDPDAPDHTDDEQQVLNTMHCSGALNADWDMSHPLDWHVSEIFARAQTVVLIRRLAISNSAGLPTMPARGPPVIL